MAKRVTKSKTTKIMHLRLPVAEHEALRLIARHHAMSMTAVLRQEIRRLTAMFKGIAVPG